MSSGFSAGWVEVFGVGFGVGMMGQLGLAWVVVYEWCKGCWGVVVCWDVGFG